MSRVSVQPRDGDAVCPSCRDALDGLEALACPECGVERHVACAEEFGRECPACGAEPRPLTNRERRRRRQQRVQRERDTRTIQPTPLRPHRVSDGVQTGPEIGVRPAWVDPFMLALFLVVACMAGLHRGGQFAGSGPMSVAYLVFAFFAFLAGLPALSLLNSEGFRSEDLRPLDFVYFLAGLVAMGLALVPLASN